MKVGDYVRTIGGLIGKVIEKEGNSITYEIPNRKENDVIDIIKSSPNIIDLIEVGDYVNGKQITRIVQPDICGDEELSDKEVYIDDFGVYEEWIESIVTHDQFSQMEYKVGE